MAPPAAEVRPPLSLVGAVLATGQALLWDAELGEYALVRVGSAYKGFAVFRLFADRVVLAREGRLVEVAMAPPEAVVVGGADLPPEPSALRPAGPSAGEPPAGPSAGEPPAGPAAGEPSAGPGAPMVAAPIFVPPLSSLLPEPPAAPPGRTIEREITAADALAGEADPLAEPSPESVPGPFAPPAAAPPPGAPPAAGADAPALPTLSMAEARAEVSAFIRGESPYRAAALESGAIAVAGIAPGSLLGRLGLRDGDQIIAAGGIALGAPDAAMKVYTALYSMRKADIVLLRGGKRMVLRLNLVP